MTTPSSPGLDPVPSRSIRLAYVVTHPMTVRYLLRGQLAFLAQHGFDVHVLAGPGVRLHPTDAAAGVSCWSVRNLDREVRVVRDLLALFEIFRILRRLRPDIVNASTPKAAFLGLLASLVARVPHRIYTQRGLRLETIRGLHRIILTLTEKTAAACAHRVVAVSASLRTLAVELGLVADDKIEVLGEGSSNGIDTTRFHARRGPEDLALRNRLGIEDGAPVVGFLGRLTRDKGTSDLLRAFTEHVIPRLPKARLLLVGGFEDGDAIPPLVQQELERNPAILVVGFVEDSAPYYRLMDVLAFPSYREGFPNAPLEAAASELPVAGYDATGTVDAVIDGTGLLVPVGDVAALGDALSKYLVEPNLRRLHGKAGRARVVERFRAETVWNHWRALYLREARS